MEQAAAVAAACFDCWENLQGPAAWRYRHQTGSLWGASLRKGTILMHIQKVKIGESTSRQGNRLIELLFLFLLVFLPLGELYQSRIQLSAFTTSLSFQMIGMMHLVSPLLFRFGYLFLAVAKVRSFRKSRLALTALLLAFLSAALWNALSPLPLDFQISRPNQLPVLLCNWAFYCYLFVHFFRTDP